MGSLSKTNKEELQENSIRNLWLALTTKDIKMILISLAEMLMLTFANTDTVGNTYFWSHKIVSENTNPLLASIVAIRNDVLVHSNGSLIYKQFKALMLKYYSDSIKLFKKVNADNSMFEALTYLYNNIDNIDSILDTEFLQEFSDFAKSHGLSFSEALQQYRTLYDTDDIATIVKMLKEDGLC